MMHYEGVIPVASLGVTFWAMYSKMMMNQRARSVVAALPKALPYYIVAHCMQPNLLSCSRVHGMGFVAFRWAQGLKQHSVALIASIQPMRQDGWFRVQDKIQWCTCIEPAALLPAS